MKLFQKSLAATALCSMALSTAIVANAKIVTSIKPLAFIAQGIAQDVTPVEIIVPAGASPHDYHLKPADVLKLKSAGIVLWIGEDVDSFLEKSIDNLENKTILEIAKIEEIHPLLTKGEHNHNHDDHDDHEHNHNHDDHDAHETNWHIWYSPEISNIVATKLAESLTAQYPEKKAQIAENLEKWNRTLVATNSQLKANLAPLANKGFYVFHDAYSYFNEAYGLTQTGAFTINPLVSPGAKTLAKIKEEITEHKVQCLFAEPQFTPKVVETLQKATGVNLGTLDPMGDKIELSAKSYSQFLLETGKSFVDCLK